MSIYKKTVSVVVPIYNEVSMVDEIYSRITCACRNLEEYMYEIVFFDDGSTDGTREKIEKLCLEHAEVKCVFYTKNFGYLKNTFYCMQQAKGDCAVIIHADLQNPPELIPEFVEKWEKGADVVLGVKKKSHENKFMYFLRSVFYFLMTKVFGIKIIPHATEFELFDKSFIDILKKIKTNTPFLRGFIGEYAVKTDCVYYTQDERKKGKSKFNLNKYYDFAICGITACSKNLPRKFIGASLIGLFLCLAEFLFNLLPRFNVLDSVSFSNSVVIRLALAAILVFIILVSVLFEYIIFLSENSVEKPLVTEEKRINY